MARLDHEHDLLRDFVVLQVCEVYSIIRTFRMARDEDRELAAVEEVVDVLAIVIGCEYEFVMRPRSLQEVMHKFESFIYLA